VFNFLSELRVLGNMTLRIGLFGSIARLPEQSGELALRGFNASSLIGSPDLRL
jgi:hypothetical protein